MPEDETPRAELDFRLPDLPNDTAEELSPGGKALVSYDPLQRYLTEIRRFPLLTREEEHRLAVDYKEYGNVEAA
jgi:RNA polymerase sigma-32 factor